MSGIADHSPLKALIADVGDESPDLDKQVFRLYAAAEDVLALLDRLYPKGGRNLPGVTLFSAMERLREAVS